MSPPPGAGNALRCWLGFAGFYAASFAVLGVYMQFFPVWLRGEGRLGEHEVALVLAAQTIARTIAGPLWAQQVDRRRDARVVLVLLSFASVGGFALFGVSSALWWAWLAAFVFGCLYSPMYPITDAAAMQVATAGGFGFGRLRMVGSLAYLLVVLAAGAVLDRTGIGAVYPALLVGVAAMALASLGLPRGCGAVAEPAAATPWWALLRSGRVVLLLVAAAAIQGSHATFYNFSTLHWTDHGVSKTVAGALWAEGILAEIVLLFFARQTVDRLRPTTLLMVGGTAAAVRWIVVGTTTSVPALAATGWLHALSFAATYLGSMRALERRVPAHQRATAQGLLGAATSGVGMVVCGLIGGFAYRRWEGLAFLTMAGFAALGVVLAWVLRRQADSAQTAPTSSAPTRPA